jgi:hypothetical protein
MNEAEHSGDGSGGEKHVALPLVVDASVLGPPIRAMLQQHRKRFEELVCCKSIKGLDTFACCYPPCGQKPPSAYYSAL